MAQPSDVTPGVWWRFDRYEIRDKHICPTPDAELEIYDPWENYSQGRAQDRNTGSPYQSLLALHRNLTFNHPYELTPESEELLLAWCVEHGLLGILLQTVQQVELATRWEPTDRASEASDAGQVDLSGRELAPTLDRYIRYNIGWKYRRSLKLTGKDALMAVNEPELQGQVVADNDRPVDLPKPGTLVRQLTEPLWEYKPLREHWGLFFPGVPNHEKDVFAYPPPGSADFWKLYAEPVHTFLNGALALQNIVRDLRHISPLGEAKEEDQQRVCRGISILHALVAPISPGIKQLDDGSIEQRWVAPSLLASFAMMLLQDVSAQKRVLACKACGQLFLSAAYQAQYCTDTCRNAEQKRRHRARKKEESRGQTRSE